MADKDDKKKEEAAKTEKDEQSKDEQSKETGTKISLLTWIIIAVVVALISGSGFVVGRLLPGSSSPETTESPQENTQTEKVAADVTETDSKDTWYYNELESVVVNPNEPGATRFIRIGLILEISSELIEEEAKVLIDAKKPSLINWLNLHFKSLTLNEIENGKDMKRILLEICDAFNEILFPDAKPQIKTILIREFNIQ